MTNNKLKYDFSHQLKEEKIVFQQIVFCILSKKMHRELNKSEIINILQSQSICRLGCTDGKHPYVVPITYFFDGKHVYCQTQEGKKIKIMRKNPNVCLQIDIVNSMRSYKSILIFGKFEELKNEEAIQASTLLEENIFVIMTRSRIHQFEHQEKSEIADKDRIKLISFRINITEMTGRSEQEENEPAINNTMVK
jgi:nitroimidazol reductase NimA-like FMN-containing flavoprotein (pyridoxamine 5'-phosphate oxidase superfamily)